jgi:hypothetical protein
MEDGCAAVKRGNSYYILIYDHRNIGAPHVPHSKLMPMSFTLRFKNLKRACTVTKIYQNSRKNLFVQQAAMHFPPRLSREDIKLLNLSTAPEISYGIIDPKSDTDTITETLNPCSLLLLILKERVGEV